MLALLDRPSVAVLPLETLGGDPDFDWFADGFVEDITTELSRFRDLFVVARNSAFVYRHTPRDLHAVARKLSVQYLVEGSVRARADRVRVTAQLRRAPVAVVHDLVSANATSATAHCIGCDVRCNCDTVPCAASSGTAE